MSRWPWADEKVLVEAKEKCPGINDMAEMTGCPIPGFKLSQLMVACVHGNPEHVKELLKVPGIKIDLQNDEGMHALMCTCSSAQTVVVEMLLRADPDPKRLVNLPKADGRTPLMFASTNATQYHTKTVLKNGANVDMQEKIDGKTALMLASKNGHMETVSLLLEYIWGLGGHSRDQQMDRAATERRQGEHVKR